MRIRFVFAIIAGLVGMLFVVILLLAYYRWLGLVIVGGLMVWAGMVFSMASFVSGWTNYALSLAGVTGIIVAIGVTTTTLPAGAVRIAPTYNIRSEHNLGYIFTVSFTP